MARCRGRPRDPGAASPTPDRRWAGNPPHLAAPASGNGIVVPPLTLTRLSRRIADAGHAHGHDALGHQIVAVTGDGAAAERLPPERRAVVAAAHPVNGHAARQRIPAGILHRAGYCPALGKQFQLDGGSGLARRHLDVVYRHRETGARQFVGRSGGDVIPVGWQPGDGERAVGGGDRRRDIAVPRSERSTHTGPSTGCPWSSRCRTARRRFQHRGEFVASAAAW